MDDPGAPGPLTAMRAVLGIGDPPTSMEDAGRDGLVGPADVCLRDAVPGRDLDHLAGHGDEVTPGRA